MILQRTFPAKAALFSLLLLLVGGCASLPLRAVRHYQGNWQVGEVYEGFTSLDGKLVCNMDMPSEYNDYFLRTRNTGYHDWEGSHFSAAYVEVDGYVTSGYDPALRIYHKVLHVVRVYRVAPATAGYIKEQTIRLR